MNEVDFRIVEEMVKLTTMDMGQKMEMDRIIKTYIDPGFAMCYTCDPQVRQAFTRIKTWWMLNRDAFHKSIFIEKETTTKKKNNGK